MKSENEIEKLKSLKMDNFIGRENIEKTIELNNELNNEKLNKEFERVEDYQENDYQENDYQEKDGSIGSESKRIGNRQGLGQRKSERITLQDNSNLVNVSKEEEDPLERDHEASSLLLPSIQTLQNQHASQLIMNNENTKQYVSKSELETENAMKFALEMTNDKTRKLLFNDQQNGNQIHRGDESGDETTAASDLLLDLSGRDLGKQPKRSSRRNQSLGNTIETASEFIIENNDFMEDSSVSILQLNPDAFDHTYDTFQSTSTSRLQKSKKKSPSSSSSTYVDTSKDYIDTANRIKAAAKSARSKKSFLEDSTENNADDEPAPFVVVGQELDTFYYKNKCCKNQKEFLNWTKKMLGFSKSTTYEYIISYRVYSDIKKSLPPNYPLPQYQSHCQLLSKIPSDDLASVWMKICDANGNQMTTTILEDYLKKNQFIDKKRVAPKSRKRTESSSNVGSSTALVNKKRKRKRRRDDDDDTEDEVVSSDHQSDFEDEDLNLVSWNQPQVSIASTTQSLVEDASFDLSVLGAKTEESPPPKIAKSASTLSKTSTSRESKILPQPPTRPPKSLPFDDDHVFEVAKRVIQGTEFDKIYKICRTSHDFESLEHETWFGKIYCDLTAARPQSSNQTKIPGIERLLQIVFTRYANKEYSEGIFVIRGEFGADWFTPILQHPVCILRQHGVRQFLGGYMQELDSSAGFDSYVAFYMGPNVTSFCNQFRNVGYLPGYNCWSFTPVSTSSRSSGGSGGLRSSLGATTDEPFPKDFMLNDHSIAPNVSNNNNSINNQSCAGLDMPMEDLAASILSHLAN